MFRGALLRRPWPATAGVAAPADRRFRRPDVRPGRRRRLGIWLWRATRAVLIAALVAGAAYLTVEALLGARPLSIRRFVIQGNRLLSTANVEALVDGMRGQSIIRVNLEEFRQRLMESPWVLSATLRRVLPSMVEIGIVERVPTAIARLNQHLYLIDNTGIIIDEFGPQYREFDLPVVDGLVQTASSRGAAVEGDRVAAMNGLLDDLASAPALRRRVSQIDVSDARDVIVLLDNDLTFVRLGESRFVDRLKTYLDLAPTLREQLREIDYVDMRFDARVYARSKGKVAVVSQKAASKRH
jgi:cell division protein FtsQ